MPINPFSSLNIALNYQVGHKIQWTVDPNFTGRAPYTFVLLAYQDVGFKEPIFQKDAGQNFYAVDDSFMRQNVLDAYVYKVQLTTADGKVYLSDLLNWQPGNTTNRHRYLLAAEVSRKEWLRCTLNGMPAYLLKRKNYTPAATSELDPVTGEPITDLSTGSFGVGIAGGYYDPVLFRYALEDRQTSLELNQQGKGTDYREEIKLRVPAFPYIDPQDIIVDQSGKRYAVVAQSETAFPGTLITVKQDVSAQIIPVTDTVYSIAIPDFPDE